ncbi:MAG TPA: glycine cleavage system protein GcvH [Longimicrobiaceae bacterium]|nr:glycine cleavage system protein GcvH [Longimicrobiaceae bacterium]
MANVPQDLLYNEEHEYLKRTEEDGVFLVGITDYAQGELGDVVFVELPQAGASFGRMESFGTIEAVKAVSELFAPVAGEVAEVNDALDANPALVNSDPYGEGWMIKLHVSNPSELEGLMDAAAYERHIGQ